MQAHTTVLMAARPCLASNTALPTTVLTRTTVRLVHGWPCLSAWLCVGLRGANLIDFAAILWGYLSFIVFPFQRALERVIFQGLIRSFFHCFWIQFIKIEDYSTFQHQLIQVCSYSLFAFHCFFLGVWLKTCLLNWVL